MTSGEHHQFTSPPEHRIPVGCPTAHRHTPAPAKFDETLVVEGSKCTQHGVVVHPEHGGHVPRGRKSITGVRLAIADGSSNFRRHLFMKRSRIARVDPWVEHDTSDDRSIIFICQARALRWDDPCWLMKSWPASADGTTISFVELAQTLRERLGWVCGKHD